MILAKTKEKIKIFNQKSYSDSINRLDLASIQCSCGNSNCMKVHGYYLRSVFSFVSQIKIRVVRVQCTSCHKTHVILIESMIPFSLLDRDTILTIIDNRISITYSHTFYLKHKYKDVYYYDDMCLMNSRKIPCLLITT